jgi:small subunit ribosomal protein S1
LKQLQSHPWDSLDEAIQVGSKVTGRIVNVADYGAFLEIKPGVEGLIHVSEMSWSQHLRNPQEFMNVNDEISAVVLTLDRQERKMSLGIKQLTEDPWTQASLKEKYAIGTRHKGVVRNLTNFGLFIELEEGIDGLVHVSDLSWTKKIKHPSEFVNVGEKLDVVVLELDVDGRKLSLGHKQTTANPWDKYEDSFAVGTIHNGEISEIVDKGATVEFGDDIVAFIPTRHLEKEDGKKLKKGESADFKVIEFNKEFKRVVASHTAIFREEEEKNVKTATENNNSSSNSNNASASTLGDNNDILAELKAKMEKGGN